jgi:hypothetical protein
MDGRPTYGRVVIADQLADEREVELRLQVPVEWSGGTSASSETTTERSRPRCFRAPSISQTPDPDTTST